jgi:hypothetical protein
MPPCPTTPTIRTILNTIMISYICLLCLARIVRIVRIVRLARVARIAHTGSHHHACKTLIAASHTLSAASHTLHMHLARQSARAAGCQGQTSRARHQARRPGSRRINQLVKSKRDKGTGLEQTDLFSAGCERDHNFVRVRVGYSASQAAVASRDNAHLHSHLFGPRHTPAPPSTQGTRSRLEHPCLSFSRHTRDPCLECRYLRRAAGKRHGKRTRVWSGRPERCRGEQQPLCGFFPWPPPGGPSLHPASECGVALHARAKHYSPTAQHAVPTQRRFQHRTRISQDTKCLLAPPSHTPSPTDPVPRALSVVALSRERLRSPSSAPDYGRNLTLNHTRSRGGAGSANGVDAQGLHQICSCRQEGSSLWGRRQGPGLPVALARRQAR